MALKINIVMKLEDITDLLINSLIPFSGFRIIEEVDRKREELGKWPLSYEQKIYAYIDIAILEAVKIGAISFIGYTIYNL